MKWSARSVAVSFAFSASWHLLVLAILVLAVHPFQLPSDDRPIELQLLPPLPPIFKPPEPKPPEPKIKLRPAPPDNEPLEPAPAKPPAPLERVQPQPEIQSPAKPEPEPVPPAPLEQARPQPNALAKPVEVAPVKPVARPLDRSRPVIEPKPVEAPPAPLDVARPTPSALPPPLNVPRPAPATARALQANRAGPAVPAPPAPAVPAAAAPAPATAALAAPSEAIATAPPAPAVLTNEQVIQAPVEIRPAERKAVTPEAALPGAAGIPAAGGEAGGGALPAGGSAGGGAVAGGGGVPGGVRRPGLGDFRYGGSAPGAGMTMRLGCISPDTYKLTKEERAACLDRFGAAARGVGDLGPNIPADKQADYDRQTACRRAYKDQGLPASNAVSEGGSIAGLGFNPSLKACGPGDR